MKIENFIQILTISDADERKKQLAMLSDAEKTVKAQNQLFSVENLNF
jgi:hypothetical protein